jgi:hypothetical protein
MGDVVVVETPDETPPVVEDAPDVVVVDTGTDSGSDATDAVVVATEIDHEGRLVAIESALLPLATIVEQHGYRIESLERIEVIHDEEIREVAQVVVEEVVEDDTTSTDEPPPDEPPISKLHRWWRGKS